MHVSDSQTWEGDLNSGGVDQKQKHINISKMEMWRSEPLWSQKPSKSRRRSSNGGHKLSFTCSHLPCQDFFFIFFFYNHWQRHPLLCYWNGWVWRVWRWRSQPALRSWCSYRRSLSHLSFLKAAAEQRGHPGVGVDTLLDSDTSSPQRRQLLAKTATPQTMVDC